MQNCLGPYLLLAALGLAFFSPLLLHPTQTLYSDHSDLLTAHLPLKHFLVRSWQETGEVPLWNPYSFAGNPFIHDVQVAAFYPPHFLLYLLPPESLGAALSWLVVLHVIGAGWFMYAYARWQGLGASGALVAGVGYMFAGKWLLHMLIGGHYVLVPLAWLPLVLLWLEQALRLGRLVRATWGGVAFALIILGAHPQVTFYAGLFVASWSLVAALEHGPESNSLTATRRVGKGMCRWLAYGIWLLIVAVALSAVQLLPALEAAPLSSRSVVGVGAYSPKEVVLSLCGFVGPAPGGAAFEYRTGLGVIWLAAAVLAPFLRGGPVRFQAGVCLGLLCFALASASVFHDLPGFRWFRVPSRVFLVLALPAALMAGITTQALFDEAEAMPSRSGRRRSVFIVVGVLAVLTVALDWFLSRQRGWIVKWNIYWLTLPFTFGLAFWLVGRPMVGAHRWRQPIWGALLLADLWLLALPALHVRPVDDIFAPSACILDLESALSNDVAPPGKLHARVLDRDQPGRPGETPLGPALPVLRGIEPVRGYNTIDVHRFKEYVQFISDQDEPLAALEGIPNFKTHNPALLELLGVKYVVQPSSQPPPGKGWRTVSQDDEPRAYCFITGGIRKLSPFSLYRDDAALPRAFVVAHAAPLPARPLALEALKAADFRHTVLLDGFASETESNSTYSRTAQPAVIKEYTPNRISIEAHADAPGWLVLTDIWYPGWSCSVDDTEETVYRANFLFRAVQVAPGRHEIVFTFAPRSYRLGKLVSAMALAVVGALCLLAYFSRWRGRKVESTVTGPPPC
jgi:hypothetical protein